jgi:hypothetical protein
MKILKGLGVFALMFVLFDVLKALFSRYKVGLYYVDRLEEPQDFYDPPTYENAVDLRGTPTHICICGCSIWNLKASFEDYQISTYFLDMECANCGSLATAPTPVDREESE